MSLLDYYALMMTNITQKGLGKDRIRKKRSKDIKVEDLKVKLLKLTKKYRSPMGHIWSHLDWNIGRFCSYRLN